MSSDLYHPYYYLESEREIRLLQIHHGAGPRWKGWKRRGPSFSLVHYSLDNAPPYEAVSYAWGHTARFEKLPMSDGNNLRITKSVFEAIPYLVDRSETGLLWLDQVCIDQDDLEERGHQVALMRDVYRGAARTLIWLGLEDRETRLALSIVEELWTQVRSTGYKFKGEGLNDELLKAFDFVCNADENGKFSTKKRPATGRIIDNLMARQWFSRGWVAQELALSKAPVAFIGRHALDWDAIWISAMMVNLHCPLRDFSNINQINILSQIRDKFSRSVAENYYASLDALTLCRIIWRCSAFLDTTNPRDCIFAYLGFGGLEDFEPDYLASIPEVYTEITRYIVENVDFLDILSACHGLQQPRSNKYHGLPSWVPNFAEARWTKSLILDHNLFWDIEWDASAGRQYRGSDNIDAKKLQVFGKVADYVKEVSLLPSWNYQDRLFYQKFFDIGQQWLGRSGLLKLAMGAYLCGADWFFPYSFEDLVAFNEVYRGPGQPISEDKLVTMEGVQSLWIRTNMESSLHEGAYFLEGMNVIETAEGKLGFTRKETKPGDTIVILHGARIPYVLRKTEDESKYQIVGNCYIEGIMDGEAVDWEEDEAERFILV